jgi:hypothetical protein
MPAYGTIHGKMQNMGIRMVEVKEASYDSAEIGFDFPAGSKPSLEIGKTYLFKAVLRSPRHSLHRVDEDASTARFGSTLTITVSAMYHDGF